MANAGCSSYCTVTLVGPGKSESGWRKVTCPIS